MALGDHLRELRARLLRSIVVVVAGFIVSLFFYDQLYALLLGPYNDARVALGEDVVTEPVLSGIGGPLLLQLKLCGVAALIATAPWWTAEIWGFIVPGLHDQERKWTRVVVAVAGPLFILGVLTGYYVLPTGIRVLIGFTPEGLTNLVEFGEYFGFISKMLLVFGIAFEIPLFVIMLNLAGVVSGKTLGRHRPWIILGTFIFAAVATPSTDPFSMLMLAIPMTLLFFVSEVVARVVDRRRQRDDPFAELADDEMSPL
ncbi:twin-arginine translocase subunit TatC [Nocardioidaceae bacterium]|nr:twin-arginine translocase subunit TatC [Nocardioidaceae bacterium]